jgi:hypothetical protein
MWILRLSSTLLRNLPAPSLSGAVNILAHLCVYAVAPCTRGIILGSIILPYLHIIIKREGREERQGGQPPLSILPRVDNPDITPDTPLPLPHVTTTTVHTQSTYTILDNHTMSDDPMADFLAREKAALGTLTSSSRGGS